MLIKMLIKFQEKGEATNGYKWVVYGASNYCCYWV